jgi:hypothetical protein
VAAVVALESLRGTIPGRSWGSGGRCYDHDFLRFLTNFGEKNWRFSQKPMLWSFF